MKPGKKGQTERPTQARPPPGSGRKGKMAFMAHKDEIERRLRAAEPMASVYEAMRDKLPFSYSNLAKYVGRYLPTAIPKPVSAVDPREAAEPISPEPPPPRPPRDAARPAPQTGPLQHVADDTPKRFKIKPQSEDQLF